MDALLDIIRDLQTENILLKKTVANLQERMETMEGKLEKGYEHFQEESQKIVELENKVQLLQEKPLAQGEGNQCLSSLEELVSLKMEEVSSSIKEEQLRKERALNLRVAGLKEEDGEDLNAVLSDFFRETMHISEPQWVEASRVGRMAKDINRQIVIRFKDQTQRLKVLKHKQHLKGEKIWVNEDLTKEQYLKRKIELDKIKEARQKGLVAYLKNGKAHVEERMQYKGEQTKWIPKNK